MVLSNRLLLTRTRVEPREPPLLASRHPLARVRCLLRLAQQLLDDNPLGLVVVTTDGQLLWWNREAETVCAIWNDEPLRGDALPLNRSQFHLPPSVWQECQTLLAAPDELTRSCSDPARGLHAVIRYQPRADPPSIFLQFDYRRPRGDRDQPVSAACLAQLNRLSFQEREVALRLREGLTNREIARELRRSPLTIKSQTAAIFRKLDLPNRSRLVALLNR